MNAITPSRLLIGWLILQVTFLGGWASMHEWQRRHAPRVMLKTRPVDPNDLIRGRYQNVAFEIEQIPSDILASSGFPTNSAQLFVTREDYHRTLWLELQPGTNRWHTVKAIHRKRPANGSLCVRVKQTGEWADWDARQKTSRHMGLNVSLGLHKYFIPARYEDIPRDNKHEVLGEISVTSSGVPQLERLWVDGKPY
ncbi:MAG: GDYXXLXY domain-containing protein [Verrucomicrobiae bacterium]|nr:GDYXXLXY domain-containing protein [Verrucomicrobiae bacterium]